MYKVEKDVPLPEPKVRHNYPYEQMQVGESFWVDGLSLQALCNSNLRWSKKLNRKFICRREGEGVRIWRQA